MGHTSQVRVIDLHIAESIVVQNLELSTVCFGNVGEVLCVCGVDFLGVCTTGLVSQVVPVGSSHGKLRFMLSFLGKEVLQVVPLVDVCATHMLDFAGAEDCLSRLVTRFRERCDIWDVHSEDIFRKVGDFFKSVEAREECTPVGVNLCC